MERLKMGRLREPKKAHARPRDCPRCYTVFYGRVCPSCQHAEPMAVVNQVETELEDASTGVASQGEDGEQAQRPMAGRGDSEEGGGPAPCVAGGGGTARIQTGVG